MLIGLEFMTPDENILFWIIWLSCIVLTFLIMMNFVIAEACFEYTKVSEELENYIT